MATPHHTLHTRQILFCQYFVDLGDADTAAKKAGYGDAEARDAKTWVGMTRAKSRRKYMYDYVAELRREAASVAGITIQSVMQKMWTFANANILDYVKVETVKVEVSKGKYVTQASIGPSPQFHKMPREMGQAIKSLKVDKRGNLQIELVDPLAATKELAGYLGINPEVIKMVNVVNAPSIQDAEHTDMTPREAMQLYIDSLNGQV